MESKLSSITEKQTKFGLVVDYSFEFFFQNRKRQYTVYAIAFFIAFVYAIVSGLVFGRPEESVVVESIALASLLLIALPVAYVLGRMKEVE
jgi:hypothetical protein